MARWSPMPGPQLDAINMRAIPELLYGGARGGGKSSFLLGDFCSSADQGDVWHGLILRRTFPELEEIINQSQTVIPGCWPGSEWWKSEKTWRLPNGASLKMRSLETPEDASRLQGHSYQFIAFDELTQWLSDSAYRQLSACLRSSRPVQHMRMRATANPGGPGHHWVKARFIDPAPHGYELVRDPITQQQRVFIPAKVTDNSILLREDPYYIDRLRGVGSEELVRAWLDGDWTVVQGAFFKFGPQHIRRPFEIPRHWLRFRALDWGSARPTACLWCAVSDGDVPNVPTGQLVVYRELYTASEPNVGLRLTVEQVADQIVSLEILDGPISYSVADPAIFAADGGPSIGERFAAKKVFFRPADNRRIGKLGAMAGWDLVRQRLRGEEGESDPMLSIFSTCTNLIRTLPALQHDPKRPEDCDTSGEDHAPDALRYACASRPWIAAPPPRRQELHLEMLWRQRAQQRERARI